MLQHHPGSSRSDLFSASQYGGGGKAPYKTRINYFVLPIFILELIGLACLWALFYYLRFTTVFPYHHRVFACNDQTLSKPNFLPDDFTIFVSETTLYCVSFIIPPIVILLGETMFWLFSTKPRKIVLVSCIECKIHLFARRLFRFVSTFLFGALVVCIFIDSIKLITGYQRPHFLTVCNVTQTCNRLNNHSPYPSPEVLCNNRRESELRYAWLSFPSIYAGLSSFAAIFTSCYLHYMISLRGAPLLRPFLIFGLLGMAMIASFSRIQGYKNHWADVWWAWVIGGLTAIYLCHNVICFQEMYSIRDEIAQDEVKVAPFFSWFRLPRINPHKEPIYGSYDEEEQPQQQNVPVEANIENGSRNRRKKDRTYEVTTTTESYQRTIHHPNGYNPDNYLHSKNVDVNY